MTYAYGAIKNYPNEEFDFFPVEVEVGELVTTEPGGKVVWPYYPVAIKRGDTKEVVADIGIHRPVTGFTVDESNVFDLLEFYVYAHGNLGGLGGSVYDRHLSSTIPFGYGVTLKRAVGCRHFVLTGFDGKIMSTVHVTASGPGIENNLARHDVSDLFIVKNALKSQLRTWTSGTNENGYYFKMVLDNLDADNRDYTIPFVSPSTPKEISRRQIVSTKHYVGDPGNFAGPPSYYQPYRLVKKEHESGFWYLTSMDGQLVLTMVRDAWLLAMKAVYSDLKQFEKEVRERLELSYSEAMARITMNYEGKERQKAIILDSIEMLGKIHTKRLELACLDA